MKRSMKKMTSILLAVVLIVGAFTAVPLSAGAAAETVEQILGDVDGDGEVTIADATLISRYNAQMIQFTDQQLLKADVDGDGEITVIDVTWVQRYLNEMKAPEGIGKLLSEVYTTKAIPVLRESLDSTETAEIRRYADQPNVPYMNVAGFYNQFYLFGTDLTEGMTSIQSGNEYTLTNIAGTTATFDIDKDTIYTPDFESFTMPAYIIQVAQTSGVSTNYPFIKLDERNDPVDPTPLTLNLSEYGIDLRGDDTGVYAPVATISDIFATPENFYVVCVKDKIYTKELSRANQPSAAMDFDPAFTDAIREDHPADLADFTYRELCFNLDTWYGEPGQEWVHDDLETKKMDELLTEKYPEIKAMLQSGDVLTYFTGMNHLLNGLLFDGGHTTALSPLSDDIGVMEAVLKSMLNSEYAQKYFNKTYYKKNDINKRIKVRNAAYGDDYYIEKGDTAMIHFDAFAVDYTGWKDFYAGTGERPLIYTDAQGTKYDTVGVVLSGLERAKQNPEIKNIIIDMSCNGGGDSTAMQAIEWLMKGEGYIRYSNRHTGRVKISSAQFDMNFDGVFDENDVSPYTDYNYGVLTSDYAFSCGNAYPWFMHEHNSMILGEKTSGGACAIRISSAAGIEFAGSSASAKMVSDSGESVDFGCPIDVDLTVEGENRYANFYDLDLLSAKMNEYYGD